MASTIWSLITQSARIGVGASPDCEPISGFIMLNIKLELVIFFNTESYHCQEKAQWDIVEGWILCPSILNRLVDAPQRYLFIHAATTSKETISKSSGKMIFASVVLSSKELMLAMMILRGFAGLWIFITEYGCGGWLF